MLAGASFLHSAAHAGPATLIRDALLIDGTGRAPRPEADILIQDGRVSRVGPAGSLQAPSGATVVDGSGKTVIPGIINLRGLAGLVRSPERRGEDFGHAEILSHLGLYASYGVTTVATPAPAERRLIEIRDGVNSGSLPHTARVLSPFRALRAAEPRTERHPRVGAGVATARTRTHARRLVDRLGRDGADFIEFHDVRTASDSELNLGVASAIVNRSRRFGLRVIALTSMAAAASALVQAGVDVLASSVRDREVSDAFVEDMVAAGVAYAPALLVEANAFQFGDLADWLNDRYLRRSLRAGIAGMLRGPVLIRQALDPDRALKGRRFDTARRNLRKLAAGGVRIAFASGSGYPGTFEGYSEYQEAVLMKRAGLTVTEVIRAFSHGSAAALGLEGERGTLEPGRLADLVILNASPLENIHNLRELHAVLVGGRLVRL